MATTADFRNGLCLELDRHLYTIVSFQHVKPGKGGAFVRTKLKQLASGRVIEKTFNAGVKIITARIENHSAQFLYADSKFHYFMDQTTFETKAIPSELIKEMKWLKADQVVNIILHQETNTILGCDLPPSVLLEVSETEAGAEGNTATRALKPATLETGAHIQVPLFINTGDIIKVDTREGKYLDRVKKR
ncbi:MAG: elongation factor P [Bacteroidota bacterium]